MAHRDIWLGLTPDAYFDDSETGAATTVVDDSGNGRDLALVGGDTVANLSTTAIVDEGGNAYAFGGDDTFEHAVWADFNVHSRPGAGSRQITIGTWLEITNFTTFSSANRQLFGQNRTDGLVQFGPSWSSSTQKLDMGANVSSPGATTPTGDENDRIWTDLNPKLIFVVVTIPSSGVQTFDLWTNVGGTMKNVRRATGNTAQNSGKNVFGSTQNIQHVNGAKTQHQGMFNYGLSEAQMQSILDDGVSTFNTDPDVPTGVAQFKSDGTTSISTGGTTDENSVVIKGTVTDPDADTVQLDLEVQPVGTAFTNTPTHSSALLASGSEASITVGSLSNDDYHYQFRSTDSNAASSAWTSFGANAESAADLTVAVNAVPNDPTNPGQFETDGTTPISVGGTITVDNFKMKADISDPDADTVKLQVEIKPTGTAFDGTTNLFESGLVASGSTQVAVDITGLAGGPQSYHSRLRTIDSNGAVSNWVSFGGNADPNDADVTIDLAVSLDAIANVTDAKENITKTVAISADAGTGEDGNAITFSAPVKPASFTVAFVNENVIGSVKTADMQITPGISDAQAAAYNVTVRAADANSQSDQAFTVDVSNTAPSINAVADQSVVEATSGFVDLTSTDANGHETDDWQIDHTEKPLGTTVATPPWVSIAKTGANTARLSWSPPDGEAVTDYHFFIKTKDGAP